MSRPVVSRLERGEADRVTIATLERVTAALGARLDTRLLWQGEALDRLLDRRHARLVETTVELLARNGWQAATEVSFSRTGERGAIDVLGWHAATHSLLMVEAKSVVPDLQAMLAAIDRKGRLAKPIADERGWQAQTVSLLLVLPEDRTARRRIADHPATFGTAFPSRNAAVRRWLRAPNGQLRGLLFLTDGR